MLTETFNNEQQQILLAVLYMSSTISLIGSALILILFLRKQKLQRFAYKLIACLSLAEIWYYFGNFLGNPPNDSALCTIQSLFISYFALAAVLWTVVISHVINHTLFRPHIIGIHKMEVKFHLFCWGMPILFTLLPFTTNSYGSSGSFCWIDASTAGHFWRFIQFYLPLWTAFGYNLYVYYRSSRHIRTFLSQSNIPNQFLLTPYPIILLLSWFFASVNRIQNWIAPDSPLFWLQLLHVLFGNLQGFFHSIAFFFAAPVRNSICNSNSSQSEISMGEFGLNEEESMEEDNFIEHEEAKDFETDQEEEEDHDSDDEEEDHHMNDVSHQIRNLYLSNLGLFELMGLSAIHEEDTFEKFSKVSSVEREKLPSKKGGIVATSFTLFKSFVGIGILTLPHAFVRSGYVGGTVGLCVVAAMSYYCMILLIKCGRKVLPGYTVSFSSIGYLCYGKWGERIIDICILITQCGFVVGYFLFISYNVQSALDLAFGVKVSASILIIIISFISVPLVCIRSLKSLHIPALIADFIIIIGLITIFAFMVQSFHTSEHEIVHVDVFSWDIPLFFGLAVSSFEGIALVIPIEQSMKQPEKFPFLLKICVIILLSLYCTFAFVGYLAYGQITNDIITLNMPHNVTTALVKLFYPLGVLLTIPIMIFPVFRTLERYLSKYFVEPFKNTRINFFRLFIILLLMCVALFVPHFGLFLNLCGSFTTSMLAFIFPALFYLKLYAEDIKLRDRIGCWCSIVLGTVGGLIGMGMSIHAMIEEL